ncbi:glycosyltransferase, group 2 family protein [Bifidobacterium actinocoloniiforme DSM 22766]|uniref:Glycosyltransferase, group 2 family protein n=1 Tax=Bifidobacterium actinocoloniiforme DSM 22766 TaxID=1437605 RepID=A0A086Z1Y3_9BIFI|nr:glycosyltransferase, group 2 family protein [Bifidobacterium actinocoloniiforme DSM 22766]
MKHSKNVAAVVVTFNRLEKLKKVLASLEAQTMLPSHLVIVDNASTDGTATYLQEYADNFKIADQVNLQIVTLPENVGGAGGFSAGMEKGYQIGADYVWIFDDDGYPAPDALEKLVDGYERAVDVFSPDIPFACSLVKFIDGHISEMNNPVPTWDWGRLRAEGLKDVVLINRASFVSVLIPRWVMEAYGLPYKEYFIWFDDAEYTTRITKNCPGIQVLDSVVVHDMGDNKGVNFSMINQKNAWKFAYGTRNQGSYTLHHEGFLRYLLFCGMVFKSMRIGHVEKKLRRQMYGKMLEAFRFNPQIDYPQSGRLISS